MEDEYTWKYYLDKTSDVTADGVALTNNGNGPYLKEIMAVAPLSGGLIDEHTYAIDTDIQTHLDELPATAHFKHHVYISRGSIIISSDERIRLRKCSMYAEIQAEVLILH